MRSRSAVQRAALAVLVVLAVTAGACHKTAARRAAAAAAATVGRCAARAARAVARARPGPAGAGGRRCDRVEVARRWAGSSPLKAVFFALDSNDVDAAGQRAAGERRSVEKVSVVAGHHRRPLRRARNGGVQPGTGRTPRRVVVATWYRWGSRRTVSRRSVTARSSRSIRDTTKAWSKNRRAHFVVTAK